ncbi:aconitate hydratase [Proteus mirabilis]|uniref:Aconitate hydratase n=1 Tax=Proteus mirabilis TaxID=584 RepID=A0A379GHT7_PROMI|nr:aconitate hydratase [Proteus mirabilis]
MSLRLKRRVFLPLSVGTHQYEYYRLSEVARQ